MKRIAFLICMVVFVLAVAVQAQTPAQTETGKVEQELIKLEKDWGEAGLKNDIAFFDKILADDFTESTPEGYFITKAQYIAQMKSGEFVATSWVQDDIKVRVYGDAAVVTGRTATKAQYKGKDVSGQYLWTDTFIKRDGRWQCVATHGSEIPQK